jgi:hypothetical protein
MEFSVALAEGRASTAATAVAAVALALLLDFPLAAFFETGFAAGEPAPAGRFPAAEFARTAGVCAPSITARLATNCLSNGGLAVFQAPS